MNPPLMIPIGLAIYAMIIGLSLGVLLGYIIQRPRRPREMDGVTIAPRPEISHIPPQNFAPLTPKMREKLHLIPGYKDMEKIKIKNFEDAQRMRRQLGDPALPPAKMAGLEPYHGAEGEPA